MILLRVTDDDLVKLEPILSNNLEISPPNVKLSVYKNRRGSFTAVYLWCRADLGTCRIEPVFCTDWRYNPIKISDIKIIVEEGPAAWDTEF